MTRVSRRPPRPALPGGAACPCGLGPAYADCCGRLHSAAARATTAELLMRSRYSAYAVRDEAYLLATWDAATRPRRIDLDEGTEWIGLSVTDTVRGGPFDDEGVVEFVARYRHDGRRAELAERSRFRRVGGHWVYVAPVPSLNPGGVRR